MEDIGSSVNRANLSRRTTKNIILRDIYIYINYLQFPNRGRPVLFICVLNDIVHRIPGRLGEELLSAFRSDDAEL